MSVLVILHAAVRLLLIIIILMLLLLAALAAAFAEPLAGEAVGAGTS